MSRKKIAAANWKMNTTVEEGVALYDALNSQTLDQGTDVVICVPATHLYAIAQKNEGKSIHLGAQNFYPAEKGAFTGELSPAMLQSVGVSHVIIGHSERRQYFSESNTFLAEKLKMALSKNLTPIFCCGEALEIRKAGDQEAFVLNQLTESFADFSDEDLSQIVIAYEPIWAIGTGETASPVQAQEMHLAIRNFLKKRCSEAIGEKIPILYGGSVKPANAKEIFGQPDVDGGLVGGASLDAESFAQIVNSFS